MISPTNSLSDSTLFSSQIILSLNDKEESVLCVRTCRMELGGFSEDDSRMKRQGLQKPSTGCAETQKLWEAHV